MTIRVISGTARGRKLKSVPGDLTRPVTDRVKEALFNILAGDVVDSRWWDMFAGTGAIGIEALSRGAAFVRFTDLHRTPIETIRSNVSLCGFNDRSEITQGDAIGLLSALTKTQFDYIYIAPPQYHNLWSKTLYVLDEYSAWLSPDGWVLVQIDPKEYEQIKLMNLKELDQRKYGKTLLVFLSIQQ